MTFDDAVDIRRSRFNAPFKFQTFLDALWSGEYRS